MVTSGVPNNKCLTVVALVLALTSPTSNAFVPSVPTTAKTTASSKIAPHHHQKPRQQYAAAARGSGTSLSMAAGGNLIDRFFRVTKSNMNKFVSGLENPEKVIVQAVEDMQSDLVKIRQAYAEATASQRRLQKQKQQVDAVARDWHRRATLALEQNKEGLAREALTRRQSLQEQASDLQQQIDTQTAATDQLYTAMKGLEQKIREAVSKKDQLVARARTAKSTQQVNDMLSGLTGKTSMDAFNRMEEKVQKLEAVAQVSAEMGSLVELGGASAVSDSSSLESQFRLLEQSNSVEEELTKMKIDLKLLSPATSDVVEEKSVVRERVSIPVGKGEKIYIQ